MGFVQISRVLVTVILMSCAFLARASTVSYFLDQSNVLPDGVDYLSVQISDDHAGQLDFSVSTLPALSGLAGENYGIQAFALSFLGDLEALSADSFILPEGWSVQFDRTMSEAGRFDVRLSGTGSHRQDPLEFAVTGLDLGGVEAFFAAHVAGFAYQIGGDCLRGDSAERGDGACGDTVTSGFFFGGRPAEVPLPPAIVLFVSGLLGLVGIVRRRHGAPV